jgi:hypothetical protein
MNYKRIAVGSAIRVTAVLAIAVAQFLLTFGLFIYAYEASAARFRIRNEQTWFLADAAGLAFEILAQPALAILFSITPQLPLIWEFILFAANSCFWGVSIVCFSCLGLKLMRNLRVVCKKRPMQEHSPGQKNRPDRRLRRKQEQAGFRLQMANGVVRRNRDKRGRESLIFQQLRVFVLTAALPSR